MKAMVLNGSGPQLEVAEREMPVALPGEVLVRVRACGVCRTDLHIVDGELPPAEAFWSVTIYDDDHHLAANPIGRYALGDRDATRTAPDGTLDILIQHDDPGPERRANWLPAPAGAFNLIMRVYHPKPAVLAGGWAPPPVTRVLFF